MPEIPIRFTGGINRLKGSAFETIYDISNARLDPFDEVKAWKRGNTENATWLPNRKPWVKFSERWFDRDYMDDYFIYRNRLYMTRVNESDTGVFTRTLQHVENVEPNAVYENNQLNVLQTFPVVSLGSFIGQEANRPIFQGGALGNKRSWDSADPGIQGITLSRAVDYLFIPLDKFGQAGPWTYVTVLADLDPSGSVNISGTDVYTAEVEFTFSQLIELGADTVLDYASVLIYRTIEYDLEGITVEASYTGAAENVPVGGYFLEGVATDSGYTSNAYWPFNIQREDSGRSEQLGPALERSRNLWSNSLGFNRQIGAKAAHMDGGVAIYGNVRIPTNIIDVVHRQAGVTSEGTYTMVNGSPDTITRASGSFVADGIRVGDTISVNGFGTQANNRTYTVANVAATTITLDTNTTVAGEASANAIITTAPNFVYQYRYQKEDGTNEYGIEKGGLLGLSVDQRSIIPWRGESGLIVWVKHEVDITDIDDSADTISILGDWVSFFTTNTSDDQIAVTDTASNNGSFTPTGSATYSAGSTVIPVAEDITTAESSGTLTFYLIWEKLIPDEYGRYVSTKNINGQHYTATHGGLDWQDKASYDYDTIYDDTFDSVLFIREKSSAYLSQQNAPWEVTLNGFKTPDASQILAITPSRIEEVEQLTSYGFYLFTDRNIYVGNRNGNDVTLTSVESVIGLKLFGGYPLVEPVKGGVVFFGTDNNLYYMTGRQVTRLDFVVDDLFGTVSDLGYDPSDDYLYVLSDTGVWVYDFNRNIWIGQYELGQDVNNYDVEFEFEDDVYIGDMANDPFGDPITLVDDITFDDGSFAIFSEQSPRAPGLILNFYVDRVSPVSTDLIARAELAEGGVDWNIVAGDILSGDVSVAAGDTIYFEIHDPGSPLWSGDIGDGDGIIKVKGGVGAGNVTLILGAVGFDPQFNRVNFRYTTTDGGLIIEEMRENGDTIPAEVTSQEFKGTLVKKIEYIKFDYDGLQYSATASGTSGTSVLTVSTGTTPDNTRDKLAVIEVPQGGIDNYDTQTKLISFVASVSGSNITLTDTLRNAVTSQTITWNTPAYMTYMLKDSNLFRNRNLGTYRAIPNRKLYPPGRPHRFQLKLENFDTLREILIFLDNFIEDD